MSYNIHFLKLINYYLILKKNYLIENNNDFTLFKIKW